ncbi:unnamed protein product [Closterium sp. Naga37s-1]|nr:unnamed protein product [Closterium sp. Naga37s-1]
MHYAYPFLLPLALMPHTHAFLNLPSPPTPIASLSHLSQPQAPLYGIASPITPQTLRVSFHPSLLVSTPLPALTPLLTSAPLPAHIPLPTTTFHPSPAPVAALLTCSDLSSNQFTGTVPPVVSNPTDLVSINLAHNLLQGSLPRALSRLSSLTYLCALLSLARRCSFSNVSSNQLSGDITTAFSPPRSLEIVKNSYPLPSLLPLPFPSCTLSFLVRVLPFPPTHVSLSPLYPTHASPPLQLPSMPLSPFNAHPCLSPILPPDTLNMYATRSHCRSDLSFNVLSGSLESPHAPSFAARAVFESCSSCWLASPAPPSRMPSPASLPPAPHFSPLPPLTSLPPAPDSSPLPLVHPPCALFLSCQPSPMRPLAFLPAQPHAPPASQPPIPASRPLPPCFSSAHACRALHHNQLSGPIPEYLCQSVLHIICFLPTALSSTHTHTLLHFILLASSPPRSPHPLPFSRSPIASFSPCLHLPTFPPAHLPTCPPSHLPTFPPSHLPTFPPAHLPTCPPAHLPTFPPAHLPTCPPVLCAHLPMCPPIPCAHLSHVPTFTCAHLSHVPTFPCAHLSHVPTCHMCPPVPCAHLSHVPTFTCAHLSHVPTFPCAHLSHVPTCPPFHLPTRPPAPPFHLPPHSTCPPVHLQAPGPSLLLTSPLSLDPCAPLLCICLPDISNSQWACVWVTQGEQQEGTAAGGEGGGNSSAVAWLAMERNCMGSEGVGQQWGPTECAAVCGIDGFSCCRARVYPTNPLCCLLLLLSPTPFPSLISQRHYPSLSQSLPSSPAFSPSSPNFLLSSPPSAPRPPIPPLFPPLSPLIPPNPPPSPPHFSLSSLPSPPTFPLFRPSPPLPQPFPPPLPPPPSPLVPPLPPLVTLLSPHRPPPSPSRLPLVPPPFPPHPPPFLPSSPHLPPIPVS